MPHSGYGSLLKSALYVKKHFCAGWGDAQKEKEPGVCQTPCVSFSEQYLVDASLEGSLVGRTHENLWLTLLRDEHHGRERADAHGHREFLLLVGVYLVDHDLVLVFLGQFLQASLSAHTLQHPGLALGRDRHEGEFIGIHRVP